MAKSFKNEYANATPKRKSQLNEATKKWRANNPEKIREIRKRTDAKRKTQQLVPCAPYIEGNTVYTVKVVDLPVEETTTA